MDEAQARLQPFVERGLATIADGHIRLERGCEPYARSIAAVFDAYRAGPHQFSSAV
jgi:oxygen-independent coproporphyrinogen-3 oxidase